MAFKEDIPQIEFNKFVSKRLDDHFLEEAMLFDFSKASFLLTVCSDIRIRGQNMDWIRDFFN